MSVALLDDHAVGEEEDAVGDRGRARIVGDHHGRLAVARRPSRASGRGSRRSSSSRGCRSARRRRRSPAARRARERSRRAAAGRRRARTAGALAGPSGRSSRAARRSHAGSAFSPAIESGSRTFSSAVSIGSRLKNWKTKPMLAAPELGQRRCRSSCVIVLAGDRRRRRSSACRARRGCASASTCPSRKGPSRRPARPASTSSETPRSASTAVSPSP